MVDVRNHHKTVDNVDNFVINSVLYGFVDNFPVDKPHIYNIDVNFSALKSPAKIRQSAEIYVFWDLGCTRFYVNFPLRLRTAHRSRLFFCWTARSSGERQ